MVNNGETQEGLTLLVTGNNFLLPSFPRFLLVHQRTEADITKRFWLDCSSPAGTTWPTGPWFTKGSMVTGVSPCKYSTSTTVQNTRTSVAVVQVRVDL
eukprot:1161292-Pelagomonas_calceolata.AAC.1